MILTETQIAVRDAVRVWVQEMVAPRSAVFQDAKGYPNGLFQEMAGLGLMGVTAPESPRSSRAGDRGLAASRRIAGEVNPALPIDITCNVAAIASRGASATLTRRGQSERRRKPCEVVFRFPLEVHVAVGAPRLHLGM
jgi:alkylation response protein AidB-like acyl-CoA dehydrogenase